MTWDQLATSPLASFVAPCFWVEDVLKSGFAVCPGGHPAASLL